MIKERTNVEAVEEFIQRDVVFVAKEMDRLEATSTVLEARADVRLALLIVAQLKRKCRCVSGCRETKDLGSKVRNGKPVPREKAKHTKTLKIREALSNIRDIEERDDWLVADLLDNERERVRVVRDAFQR